MNRHFLFLLLALSSVSCTSMLYFPSKNPFVIRGTLPYQPRDVSFSSEDGTKLSGWYFRSLKTTAPKALILFFGGNAQNKSIHFSSLYWLIENEYSFFIFDYRGYGDSEGSSSPEGMLMDGKAAIQTALSLEKKAPLVIYAQSLGSAISLRSLIETKDRSRIQAIAVDSGFISYKKAAQSVLSKSFITWPFQWLSFLVVSDSTAPLERVSEISPIPLLVIHGDEDQTIDISLGEKLYKTANEPKEIWKIKDGKHIDSFWGHEGIYKKKFLAYLGRLSSTVLDETRRQHPE